jgi:putative hydrolase of HD superfamily
LKAVLMEALRLKELPRAGWVRAGVSHPESVAAHSWGISWLILALCPAHVDRGHALALAVIHDLPEVHAGDITPKDGVSAHEKQALEEAGMDRILLGHPQAEALKALWSEYDSGTSPEARFVKACDKLDMALQAQRYEELDSELDLSEFVASALGRIDDEGLADLIGGGA